MDINLQPCKNGQTVTTTIQKAIDDCSASGGGTVYFSKGEYITGTVFWKSNVRLFLEYGAEIKGSTNSSDYPDNVHKQMYKKETSKDHCLFFAKDCENIKLDGYGIINGQGELFTGELFKKNRPMMFRYLNCKDIRISNVKLRAPASWTNAFIGCENIWVQNIDILSRANRNGDGTDFDGCSNVFVSGCKFDCSDDCICLQNSFSDRVCQNVVVTNCIMKTKWAGLRIGLLSCSPIKDVTVTNCVFRDINCSGLKIQSAEGSILENMTFSNLVMENVVRPILMTANKFRERVDLPENIDTPSQIKNMIFTNIISKNIDEEYLKDWETQPKCIVLDCDDGNVISDIIISNVQMQVLSDNYVKRNIPHHTNIRAEGKNYEGVLPAHGLYSRNVKNLSVENLKVNVKGEVNRDIIYNE